MTTTPAMPERFTKKPVTVEAVQFKNDGSSYALILWINEGQHAAGRRFASWRNNEIIVPTLEGEHIASVGDWIIKGVKGEFYPCKPDIFEMTYDRAALQAQPAAADWQTPTTYAQRFTEAVALLCREMPPADMVAAWIDRASDDHRLQDWACERAPAWAQGIGLLDAAHVMADQPTEGVDHEPEQPAAAGVSDAEIDSIWQQHHVTNEAFGELMDAQAFEHAARAILALRPQSESEARRAAQEQLYTERERHTAEVKRLQTEIGRLQSERPQAVPMTDERIVSLVLEANAALVETPTQAMTWIVRAVEAHHGITAPAGGEVK